MILTIHNAEPFQILSSSFSIGPSETGYDLQVGADSRDFTTLFSVGANTPRMVTNVANGSYYRLKNNVGEVKVNWQRVCVDEGGSGGTFDPTVLDPYWTSAQTEDAIDEKTKDYVQINGPVLPLEWGIQGNEYPEKVFNALFSGTENVYLASVTNVDMWGIVPTDDPFDWDNYFTIDAENKELYVENVPAGLYRILLDNTGNDTGSTFWVMPGDTDDETKGIYTHTTEVPGALNPAGADIPNVIIVSNGCYASSAYWIVDKDAERMTIKFEEDPDNPGNYSYHYFLTYKPTIDEALSAYTPTSGFSTINGSAITAGGDLVIKTDTEDIELPIAAAVNDLKGNIEARLNQKYYERQEVNDLLAPKRDAAQVQKQIVDYVTPVATDITATIEDKELATSAALNDLNTNCVKSSFIDNIWKGTQGEYDALTNSGATANPSTFYIIVNNN